MISMLKIEPDEWAVIPVLSSTFILEVASVRKIDFGVLKDVKQWEEADEDDEFDSELWHDEFAGSRDFTLDLQYRKKGYQLVFWNSNYAKRIYVAYRIKEIEGSA